MKVSSKTFSSTCIPFVVNVLFVVVEQFFPISTGLIRNFSFSTAFWSTFWRRFWILSISIQISNDCVIKLSIHSCSGNKSLAIQIKILFIESFIHRMFYSSSFISQHSNFPVELRRGASSDTATNIHFPLKSRKFKFIRWILIKKQSNLPYGVNQYSTFLTAWLCQHSPISTKQLKLRTISNNRESTNINQFPPNSLWGLVKISNKQQSIKTNEFPSNSLWGLAKIPNNQQQSTVNKH